MFNARDLLGQVMGAGITPSTASRAQHAVGSNGLGSAGSPLGGLLGNLAGVASDALGSAKRGVEQNNPLAIGGLGALAGAVLGGSSGALQGGGLALLGSLAYAALNPKRGAEEPSAEEIARNAPIEMRLPQNAAEEAEQEERSREAWSRSHDDSGSGSGRTHRADASVTRAARAGTRSRLANNALRRVSSRVVFALDPRS